MSRRRRRPFDPAHPHRQLHDRRSCYASLPASARIAAAEISDPYGTPSDAAAKLEPGLHRDGTSAQGEPEWRAPEPPRLLVVRSLRADPLGNMHARKQIGEAQFHAGRLYQDLHEQAFASAVRSADPARPVIDGGRIYEPFNDRQRDAIRRLRVIDGTIAVRLGFDAVTLVRTVLLEGSSVASAARRQLAGTVKFWRTVLQLALDEIAAIAGLATRPRRPAVPEGVSLRVAAIAATVQAAK